MILVMRKIPDNYCKNKKHYIGGINCIKLSERCGESIFEIDGQALSIGAFEYVGDVNKGTTFIKYGKWVYPGKEFTENES